MILGGFASQTLHQRPEAFGNRFRSLSTIIELRKMGSGVYDPSEVQEQRSWPPEA